MQSPKLSPTQSPEDGFPPKSQSRAVIALSLILSLAIFWGLGARGLATEFGALSEVTEPNEESVTLASLMEGSAVSFADRSRPWIKALGALPESGHRAALTELTGLLLMENPEHSTRSAVLLGALLGNPGLPADTRSAAQEALVYRLSQRNDTGARWSVGADVAAVRALDREHGSAPLQASVRETLAELGFGAAPHPSLAVRVECAATLLRLSTLAPAPNERITSGATAFLLAVLRAETPAQVESPRTWPRITTLAWVKTRAAEALAEAVGTKNRFRPDGSWAHQVAEAARFESLLR